MREIKHYEARLILWTSEVIWYLHERVFHFTIICLRTCVNQINLIFVSKITENIQGQPGQKVFIKLLKMDIEEERPTDGPDCGSPNGNQPDCQPGEEKHCEWDYLRIITG